MPEPTPLPDRRAFLRQTLAAAAAGSIRAGGCGAGGRRALGAGGGRGLPGPVRQGLAAAGDRRERGGVGRVDRRERGPHRRPGRRHTRRSTSSSAPPGDRRRSSGCWRTGRARRPDRPPAREGPPPRRRGARHGPRGRQGPHRGRGQAVGRPGRVRLHASSARARPTSTPRPTTSTGCWSGRRTWTSGRTSGRSPRRSAGRSATGCSGSATCGTRSPGRWASTTSSPSRSPTTA